jgi:hypothetical protein
LDRRHDAEVVDRQHVGPVQSEHQKHLGRPSAESFHRGETFDDLLVRQHVELVEAQPLVANPGTQIAQVTHLLPAQPHAAQGLVVERVDGIGARNASIRKQRDEPSENRRRRFRRQLLADDRTDECGQVIVALAGGEAAGADAFDGGAQNRIAPP